MGRIACRGSGEHKYLGGWCLNMIWWKRLRTSYWKERRRISVVDCITVSYYLLYFLEDHGTSLLIASGRSVILWSLVSRLGPCALLWPVECGHKCYVLHPSPSQDSLCSSAGRASVPSSRTPRWRTYEEPSNIQPSADVECVPKGKPLLL